MKIRNFTENDYPAIVDIHQSLDISWPERPRTPEGWAEIDRRRNPKCKFQRWVAEVDGSVVGYGAYGQSIFEYHPQRFNINIEVSPDYQRRGIGGALYERIMDGLQPFDARILRADAFTNLPQGFEFLQKRGFYEAFRETPVRIDTKAFDPSPYTSLETKLQEKGIVIKTVREMEADPERDQKLYELYWEASADVPQEGLDVERPSFDTWAGWGLNDPAVRHDAYFIALDGEAYVGLREMGVDPDRDIVLGGLLGVRRAYRRQGIGLAMQVRGIVYAKEHGYPELKTCTAVRNHPMQAIFDKLGYVRGPEWLQCQKDIDR